MGTVSMWPASNTRDGLSRRVRASTALPLRAMSNPLVCSRTPPRSHRQSRPRGAIRWECRRGPRSTRPDRHADPGPRASRLIGSLLDRDFCRGRQADDHRHRLDGARHLVSRARTGGASSVGNFGAVGRRGFCRPGRAGRARRGLWHRIGAGAHRHRGAGRQARRHLRRLPTAAPVIAWAGGAAQAEPRLVFGVLANVVWTNYGPYTVQHRGRRVGGRSDGGREQPMLSRRSMRRTFVEPPANSRPKRRDYPTRATFFEYSRTGTRNRATLTGRTNMVE